MDDHLEQYLRWGWLGLLLFIAWIAFKNLILDFWKFINALYKDE